jgi:hypothetical protein
MNKNRQTNDLVIPFNDLSPEALQGRIEAFVTRDGMAMEHQRYYCIKDPRGPESAALKIYNWYD